MKISPAHGPVCDVRCHYGDLAGPSARRRLRSSPKGLVEGKGNSVMTHIRGVIARATAVLLLVAVTSCGNDGNDPVASGSPTPSSPAPTTATTTPPSETEVASAAASAALRKYYDVRNQLRQDPSQPLSLLKSVAISTELAAQQNLFEKERRQGLHQVGQTEIAELEVQSVNLDNSDPKGGKVPTVQIELCFDVSDVDVVNKNGKSAISPDRPDTGWIQFLVANYEWGSNPDAGWRVASSKDIERTPCEAS